MAKKSLHKKTSHAKPSLAHKTVKDNALLHPKKVGLALGYTATIYILLLSICSAISNRGIPIVNMLSSVYMGYNLSFFGILIGMAWAFVDWFIAGFIFALIYNKVQNCKCGCMLLKK